MVLYTKTKTGNYRLDQLQGEINADVAVVPSCNSITGDGDTIGLNFAVSLSAGEETQLDTLISDHTPNPEVVDASVLPLSTIDGVKLAVHTSYKPEISGIETYAMWAGSGDDPLTPTDIGGGDLLQFHIPSGTSSVTRDVHYNSDNGRVWVHEGYLKFSDAGVGDYITANVMAKATPLQQVANLDLDVGGDDWIKYAPGGPGTGSYGWADATKIQLLPRSYSKDGHWDFDGVNLTPNFGGTGGYHISSVESMAHRYFNKIPCYGTCATYFSMTSEETTEIPPHYFMRITAHNVSDSDWHASIIMELYRQRTVL